MNSQACRIAWLLLGALLSPAQAAPSDTDPLTQPRFESIGADQIPRGVIASMAQDQAGFLWLATGDGLVRYDGYRFRPQERDSSDPLQRNLGWIRAMWPARDGRLWIGTESDGLAVYDPKTAKVTPFPAQNPAQRPAPTIFAIAESADGTLWVGSRGSGIDEVDLASGKIRQHRHGPQAGSLPDDRIEALLVDREGTLWVGSWQGLSRRKPGADRFEPLAVNGLGAGSRVQALLQASDGQLWVGLQSGALLRLDPASGRARPQVAGAAASAAGAVTQLLETPDGQIWVGRDKGLSLHQLDGSLLRLLQHDPRLPDGLAGNQVTSLLRDRAGWVWVAGLGLGLQRHNPANQAFRVRSADLRADSPLADADIRALLQLDNGEIWAASQTTGVAVMDSGLRVIGSLPGQTAYKRAGQPAALQVQAMAQAADGSVWLAAGDRLQRRDRQRRLLQELTLPASPARALRAAADGQLWIATQDGLFRLSPGAKQLRRLSLEDGQPLLGEVNALASAPDGALWVGSATGLYRLPPGQSALQPVHSPEDAALGNSAVIGLLFDRQQQLWVDTSVAGLHRKTHWDGETARFDRISQRHGVFNRPFGANLLQDARGRIWTHMHVYDPANDQLDALSAADGVRFGTGWFYSYSAMADGRLLFGGSKGLLVVNPAHFDRSTFAPALVVTELRLNGLSQAVGPAPEQLRMSASDRSISIEFAALDYSDPQRLRYAHQLEGFDADWIPSGADFRRVSYSKLDPGDYRLRVRASNRSGVFSAQELVIPLQVQPAWWQLPWVRLALVVALTLLLFAWVQRRTQRLRRQQVVLAAKVLERTTQLEQMTQALQLESAALQNSSLTDPLTGLRNRRYLSQHIEADIAISVRRHEDRLRHGGGLPGDADLIFFLIDIDRFKQVNDELGHAAGDAVLMQMRDRLLQVFRDSDHIVRWGGEEFLVVARGTDRHHAPDLAERARLAVGTQPFVLPDGTTLHKTCSIGFAAFPLAPALPRALSWNQAIDTADEALYAAKHAGRDGWVGLLSARAEHDSELLALLRRPVAEWPQIEALQLLRSPPVESQPMHGEPAG